MKNFARCALIAVTAAGFTFGTLAGCEKKAEPAKKPADKPKTDAPAGGGEKKPEDKK